MRDTVDVLFFGGPSDGDAMPLTRDEIVALKAPNSNVIGKILEPQDEPFGGRHYTACACSDGPQPLHFHWHDHPWLQQD